MEVWVKTFKRGDNVILNGIKSIGVVVVDEKGEVVLKKRINVNKLKTQVHESAAFIMHEKAVPGLWASLDEGALEFDKAAQELVAIFNKYLKETSTLHIVDDSYTGLDYLLALNSLPSLNNPSRKFTRPILHHYNSIDKTEYPENICESLINEHASFHTQIK